MVNRRLREELLETVRGLHAAGAIEMQNLKTFRVVHAPAPVLPPLVPFPTNCVVSVVLEPGERVAWTWTCDTGGARYVSGYTIIKPRRSRRRH